MVDTHLETEESENESLTQRKQRSTRMLYGADDAVVANFFAHNTPRSQSLHDLIYLFALEHGSDADASQLLRERFATLAGINRNTDSNGAASATELAPKVKKPARTRPKASKKAEPVAADSEPAQTPEVPEVSEATETVETAETELVAPVQEKEKPEASKPQSAAHNSAADDDDGPSEAQQRLAADFQSKFASRNRSK